MPPHARAGLVGRGHRFAAYPPVFGGHSVERRGVADKRERRTQPFFVVRPEEAGRPAGRSGVYVFDSWLGDVMVEAHPAFLVTTSVKRALEQVCSARCVAFSRSRVQKSRFFAKHSPNAKLPALWLLQVSGVAGRDEMGITADGSLVVSKVVLDSLVRFKVPRATIQQFSRTEVGRTVRSEDPCRRTRR